MQPKMKLVVVLVEESTLLTTRGCSYKDFLNFQPRNFTRTEGVVGLTMWFEKMESVFRISNCATGIDKAHEMSWKDLMKLMIEVYYPRNEIQKLENELWNLTVKGTDVAVYTRQFQELSLLCPRMVSEEENKIERYIWGLSYIIQGNVTSSKPTILQDSIKMAKNLMDQKVRAIVIRDADNKRKWEDEHEGNHRQQRNKRQEVGRVYVAGTGNKTGYAGTLPLCEKCKLHHHGPCLVKCGNCKKVGHQARDC
ncbi:putative reverse transcriptase domain-containing protein [Tanacetum coccineum]